jgi:hypothetical protein
VHLFGYKRKVIPSCRVIIAFVHSSRRDKHLDVDTPLHSSWCDKHIYVMLV